MRRSEDGRCDWCEDEARYTIVEAGWTDYVCPLHLAKWGPTYGTAAVVSAR